MGEGDSQQCKYAAHLCGTKVRGLDTDDLLCSIAIGMNAEDQDNVDADVDLMCSLGRTPTRETERLFVGGNLDSYRIYSEEDNPTSGKVERNDWTSRERAVLGDSVL